MTEENKVFMNKENMAIFTCPECQHSKAMNLSKYKDIQTAVKIKVKCPQCGHVYSVLVERRQFYRKTVNLPGSYFLGPRQIQSTMMVKDISRHGLSFEVGGRQNLKEGDEIIIQFNLDDRHKTPIKKTVAVRTITDRKVGAAFVSVGTVDLGDRRIGFYLMP
ncbi:PilZ domain-containing protein [Desulfobacterales bacterium HSG16]|nr:PilZ domain-containing protein [Desulfobacterales bacterium HSG16]